MSELILRQEVRDSHCKYQTLAPFEEKQTNQSPHLNNKTHKQARVILTWGYSAFSALCISYAFGAFPTTWKSEGKPSCLRIGMCQCTETGRVRDPRMPQSGVCHHGHVVGLLCNLSPACNMLSCNITVVRIGGGAMWDECAEKVKLSSKYFLIL